MGAGAAGDACIAAQPDEIDRLVILGTPPDKPADKLKCPYLFIVARDDRAATAHAWHAFGRNMRGPCSRKS